MFLFISIDMKSIDICRWDKLCQIKSWLGSTKSKDCLCYCYFYVDISIFYLLNFDLVSWKPFSVRLSWKVYKPIQPKTYLGTWGNVAILNQGGHPHPRSVFLDLTASRTSGTRGLKKWFSTNQTSRERLIPIDPVLSCACYLDRSWKLPAAGLSLRTVPRPYLCDCWWIWLWCHRRLRWGSSWC